MRRHLLWTATLALFTLGVPALYVPGLEIVNLGKSAQGQELRILPQRVVLDSPEASQQLLVTLVTPPRATTDLTRQAK